MSHVAPLVRATMANAFFAYSDNYLIDTDHAIIMDVDASRSIRQAEEGCAFGPHAFRHMLARHAAKTCASVAELVATSQNLGHKDVLTTLRSYGQISRERQRALVTGESEDDLDD